MSVQAGVMSFGAPPIPAELANAIADALRPFGSESQGSYRRDDVLLVYGGDHVTVEQAGERQPFTSPTGLVMTWDGRLDNQEELVFALARQLHQDHGDVAIAAAVYEKWGTDGLRRLVGDWSLAIWDARNSRLTLASDYAGTRALYYARSAGHLHWSTSLGELAARLGHRDDLETRFVVGFLTGLGTPEISPYRRILSVPVAHALSWDRDGRSWRSRFWTPPIDRRHHGRFDDYLPEFRARFAQAVGSRARSTRPVYAELSGGLDSSSIVCVADRLWRHGQLAAPVHTVSCVTDSSPESDERRFIVAVEEHIGRPGAHVLSEQVMDVWDETWGWVTPLHPSGKSLTMFQVARDHDARVLLSGRMGDVAMANTPEQTSAILESLEGARFIEALKRGHRWCRSAGRTIWDLTGKVALEYLPTRRSYVRSMLDPFGASATRPEDAAAEAFHLTAPLAQIWREHAETRAGRLLAVHPASRRSFLADLLDSTELRWLQSPPELSPVTYSHPYADRRLIEFMLAIPANVAVQPGQPRAIMRAALEGVLPPRVRARFSKGFGDPLHLRAIRQRVPADLSELDSWCVVERSYVDLTRLRAALCEVKNGASRRLKNLQLIMALERWLRERSSSNATSK